MSETFDLIDAIQGVSYPESTVTLYMNVPAIRELEVVEADLRALPEGDEEGENALFEKRAELIEAARKSAIHIEMKGLPRSVVNAMTKKAIAKIKDKNEQAEAVNKEFVLRSIVKIVDSEGRKASFDDAGLMKFFESLREPDWEKILGTANELSFQTLKYEQKVTDPNFS